MLNKIFDTIIVGCGPAGMTAGIYLGRSNKSVCIIDKDGFGGNAAKSPKIENYPGFKSVSGLKLTENMYKQMSEFENVEHILGHIVLVRYNNRLVEVFTDDNLKITGKTLIIATGTEHKKLNFETKNLHYCVLCDGPFYKDGNVIVVGSGNTGATDALELANYCKNVYLCDVTLDMCCEEILKKRVSKNKKIHWLPNCSIESIKNDENGTLTEVTLNTLEKIKVNAIFGAIGMTPNTSAFIQFANVESSGYIDNSEEKIPGIFAAGDCVKKDVRQITTAINDGTIAAIKAIKFLEELK